MAGVVRPWIPPLDTPLELELARMKASVRSGRVRDGATPS